MGVSGPNEGHGAPHQVGGRIGGEPVNPKREVRSIEVDLLEAILERITDPTGATGAVKC